MNTDHCPQSDRPIVQTVDYPTVASPPNDRGLPALFEGPIDVRSFALSGIFLILLFAVLKGTRDLFLPVLLAFFLSFLLAPIVRRLTKLHIPESLGAVLVFLFVLGTVTVAMYELSQPAMEWLEKAPQSVSQVKTKVRHMLKPVTELQEATQQATDTVEEITEGTSKKDPLEVQIEQPGLGQVAFTETQEFLVGLGIMFVLLYFLLASGDLFLEKLVRGLPRLEDKKLAVQIVRQIEQDISTYLLTVTLINLGLGLAIGVTMYMLGMPNPVLWGVMGGLLNFVPYFGALVGMVAVSLAALLSFDSSGHVLAVLGSYLVLTNLEAYLVTPTILGNRLTLNRVAIFIWLTLWGWLWGIPGVLIAIPLLVIIKIICDRIELFTPVGEFLGQ
ncbi:MAG: AI-2E family transporter [Candidatus Binatia bacterium]